MGSLCYWKSLLLSYFVIVICHFEVSFLFGSKLLLVKCLSDGGLSTAEPRHTKYKWYPSCQGKLFHHLSSALAQLFDKKKDAAVEDVISNKSNPTCARQPFPNKDKSIAMKHAGSSFPFNHILLSTSMHVFDDTMALFWSDSSSGSSLNVHLVLGGAFKFLAVTLAARSPSQSDLKLPVPLCWCSEATGELHCTLQLPQMDQPSIAWHTTGEYGAKFNASNKMNQSKVTWLPSSRHYLLADMQAD